MTTTHEPAPTDVGNAAGDTASTCLSDALIASYSRWGCATRSGCQTLPFKSGVAGVMRDLLTLLFPGFFDERLAAHASLRQDTAQLLASVAERLEAEVCRALRHASPMAFGERELRPLARGRAQEFLAALPALRDLLQTDIEAAYQGDPAALSREEVIISYPFVEAIAAQRMAHLLYRKEVPLIPRIMTEWAHRRSGLDLHPGAAIGSHFFVDHCTGTVVGETCRIGDHVKLYQGVGLVARSLAGGHALRGQRRHPQLEDRVTVYAGATIMGGDTVVGEGSTVGANVFLTHSVPPHSLVVADDVRNRVVAKERREVDYQI
jgi:serine O-acetyltransferase